MNINSALHALYSNRCLFFHYQQHLSYKTGLYTDGMYIGNIIINKNDIVIQFPSYCDIISNIYIPNAKFELIDDNKIITSDIILLKKYKNIKLRVYEIKDISNLEIYFDVYLMKDKLKSAL